MITRILRSKYSRFHSLAIIILILYTYFPQKALGTQKGPIIQEFNEKGARGILFKNTAGGRNSKTKNISVEPNTKVLMAGVCGLEKVDDVQGVNIILRDPQGNEYGRISQGTVKTLGLELVDPTRTFQSIEEFDSIRGFILPSEERGIKSIWINGPTPGVWQIEIISDHRAKPYAASAEAIAGNTIAAWDSCDICIGAVAFAVVVALSVVLILAAPYIVSAIGSCLISLGVGAAAVSGVVGFLTWAFLNDVISTAMSGLFDFLGDLIARWICTKQCAGDTEMPYCGIVFPRGGENLSGKFGVAVKAFDASEINIVDIQYSTDRTVWENLGPSFSSDGETWSIDFDTEYAGIMQDGSVWIRARALDKAGNTCDWVTSGSFIINNVIAQPTSIIVAADVAPASTTRATPVTVSGHVAYNTGQVVYPGTVSINISSLEWTAPLNPSGDFSREIVAPTQPGSYPVNITVNDGLRQGSISRTLTVTIGNLDGANYSYDSSLLCKDVEGDNSPVNVTNYFRSDDDRVLTWLHLQDVYLDNNDETIRVKIEYFIPDGTLLNSPLVYDIPNPGEGYYYPDYYIWQGWNIAGCDISELSGRWTAKISIDEGSGYIYKKSEYFTMSYEFVEHKMARGVAVTTPFEPISPTNTFYQSNTSAYTWAQLDNVTEGLEVRWNWYEPNGTLYLSYPYEVTDPVNESAEYYEWYKFWGYIDIHDNQAEEKCGNWYVDVFIRDPFGTWKLEYKDYFRILESPNVRPVVQVVPLQNPVPENGDVQLSVSATDNTYLKKVTLFWGSSSYSWDNLNSPSFAITQDLGMFPSGTQIEFYARVEDTSGNKYECEHKSVTIVDSDLEGPIIQSVVVAEHNGDSDGVIEYNEQVRISWQASDIQGVSSCRLWIDESEVTVSGDYYAISGPFATGEHAYKIVAFDNHYTPAMSIQESTFSVAGAALMPDLIVESLSLDPASPTTQDTATITAVVRNQGEGPAVASTLRIILSGCGDLYYPVSALGPGESSSPIRRIASNMDIGDNFIIATADEDGYGGTLTESDEGNNTRRLDFSVINLDTPPGPFSLMSPQCFSQMDSDTRGTTLRWYPSSGATSYDVYFAPGCCGAFYINTADTQVTINGLTPGQQYAWHVVAKNAIGETRTSSFNWWFTVASSEPGQFGLIYPSNGQICPENTSAMSLIWGVSSTATSYDVFLGTDPNPPFYLNTTDTLTTVPVILGNTYYWKVRANSAEGSIWALSGTWSLAVGATPPGAFTLRNPGNNTISNQQFTGYTVDWLASTGATSYDVYFGTANPPQIHASDVGTVWETLMMPDYTVYYWDVVAKNDLGTTSSSNGPFKITKTFMKRSDFNTDGLTDILWRYQGTGAYQGLNVIWLMNQTTGATQAPLSTDQAARGDIPASVLMGTAAATVAEASQVMSIPGSGASAPQRNPKSLLTERSESSIDVDPMRRMKNPLDIIKDPIKNDRTRARVSSPLNIPTPLINSASNGTAPGTIELAAAQIDTEIVFSHILDTGWEIAGTGDFGGDWADIVWRYYGTGAYQGLNVIWQMNDMVLENEVVFSQVLDTNWRIVSTGDFNGDGESDILWRYTGMGALQGYNVIWYMAGATFVSELVFSIVPDTNWKIVGTGDFNFDGHTDILWRYQGTGIYQGLNVVWYMNRSEMVSELVFSQVLDIDWQIVGTGDYDGDSKVDILWRNYGSGAHQGLNVIWYMDGIAFIGEEIFSSISDTNWKIVIH